MVMRSKYGHLLSDSDVKRWYDNVARGSHITADVSLRRLGLFCESYKMQPKDLLAMGDTELKNIIMDTISRFEKEGRAGSYIESIMKGIRSWLSYNNREIKTKIKIRGTRDTPSLREERTPTNEELKKIFLSGDKKERVSSVLMAHAGLRIEVIGNYNSNDGLRVRDIPELKLEGGKVEFEKVPAIIIVRHELSKAGHQYITFLSEEGCQYLQDYLEERLRGGEKLTKNSAIVTPKIAKKEFIKSVNVSDGIRTAIRKAGFSWRPYVLRSFFDTQLMLAESKGLVLRDYRAFWMGHKGDIENRYTTNKCRLSESVVDDMRKAYERSQPFLSTSKAGESNEEKLQQEFRRQLLLVSGFNAHEISDIDLSELTDEQLQDMVRTRLLGIGSNQSKQKVIGVNELEKYLASGWDFIANLPNGNVLIRNSTSFVDRS